jgi:hypothetical protein
MTDGDDDVGTLAPALKQRRACDILFQVVLLVWHFFVVTVFTCLIFVIYQNKSIFWHLERICCSVFLCHRICSLFVLGLMYDTQTLDED